MTCVTCHAPTDNEPIDGELRCDGCLRAWAEYHEPRAPEEFHPTGGAVSWEFRRPRTRPSETHWMPFIINNELRWQAPPDVHVSGTRPRGDTPGTLAARELSEEEAQRRTLALALDSMTRAEQAAALGLTPRQLKRRLARR